MTKKCDFCTYNWGILTKHSLVILLGLPMVSQWCICPVGSTIWALQTVTQPTVYMTTVVHLVMALSVLINLFLLCFQYRAVRI